MRDLHTEFVYRKIQKPSKWVAWPVWLAFRAISKRHNVEFSYDDDYLKMQHQQMVYLCQHRSRNDYIYVFAGLKRLDLHFLCGYQNVFQPGVYSLFKKLGVIAKMLYQPDVRATMQLMGAAKLGGSLVIFPEGIQSTSGSTHPINPATMKLLAKLKLPVALVSLKGAYFTRSRYSADIKKGKISVQFSKLFDREDFDRFTKEELYERLLSSFQYNEFAEFAENKVAFRGKKPNIHGLDNIIYKCPQCAAEYHFVVEGSCMRCTDCGFAISMDEYYDISAVSGTLPFANIDTWYKWQRHALAQSLSDESFILSTKVCLRKINTQKLSSNYSLMPCGEGILTLTKNGMTYSGTRDGEPAEILFHPKQVYSLSMSLDYDLDLYYDGAYYNFKLLENEKQVAKWMLAAEEIHNLYDPEWCRVSNEVYHEE